MTSANIKDEIKSALDIVDVISETVSLARGADGIYTGATSALSKSGASLHVDRKLQLWNDFSGRAQPSGGDIFNWLAYKHGLSTDSDFPQLLKIAADKAGVQLEELTEEQKEKLHKKEQLQNILTKAAEEYHSNLIPEIREYINKKWGINDETIDRLKIGYAKTGTGNVNLGKIADCEEWIESGLFFVKQFETPDSHGCTRQAFEIFKGRVIFPYWFGGRVVNFAARGDFSSPISTPDVAFEKSPSGELIKYKKLLTHNEKHPYVDECISNGYIWGNDTIKGNDYCIITEGIADAIMLMQNGYPVLSPVTTKFPKHDREKLVQAAKRLKTVYICNDNEESGAGEDGAIRTGLLLKSEGVDIRIMMLPKENLDKMDIAEYFLRHTKDEFEVVKEQSKDILVHLLHKVQLSNCTDVAATKTANVKKAVEFAKNVLKNIKDEDEASLFIRNNMKAYFPKFTNEDIKTVLKAYKTTVAEDSSKNPDQECKMIFDLDSESGRSTMVQVLAHEIMQQQHLKFVAGSLRMYNNGVYTASPEGIMRLHNDIVNLASEVHRTPIIKKHTKNVVELLEVKNAISLKECNTTDDEIAVNNGILNLETFELSEFTPEKVFFNKFPVDYDPNAPEPVQFLQLMESVFKGNEEQYKLMQEVFGYCLLNNYKYQVLIYLLGDGGNGKGTVLKILNYLLGEENTSAATLHQLTDHNNVDYFVARLHGKRANICGDVGSMKIENTENIKKLSSNTDLISARLPYGQPFEFINTAKIILAMNKLPEKNAFTTGDKRRDVIITFRNPFAETDKEIKGLSEIIRDSGKLPGVLNWAIEGLKRLERNQKFSDKRTIAQRGLEYDMKSNPMKHFVDDCIEEDVTGGCIPNYAVYAAYNDYRRQFDLPELPQQKIKEELIKYCGQISIKTYEKRILKERLKNPGDETRKQLKAFFGIKLIEPEKMAKSSTEQITFNNLTSPAVAPDALSVSFARAFW